MSLQEGGGSSRDGRRVVSYLSTDQDLSLIDMLDTATKEPEATSY